MIGSGPWWSAGQTFTSWVPIQKQQPPQYSDVLVSDGKVVRLRTLKRGQSGALVWANETGDTDNFSAYHYWAERPALPKP